MLNDFEACAYAVPNLDATTLVHLRGKEPINFVKYCKYLLVGPGTGYGVSMITNFPPDGAFVLCSEGGHMGVSCLDQEHFEFE